MEQLLHGHELIALIEQFGDHEPHGLDHVLLCIVEQNDVPVAQFAAVRILFQHIIRNSARPGQVDVAALAPQDDGHIEGGGTSAH